MFVIVGLGSLVYGAIVFAALNRSRRKREARLVLLLCLFVSLYFLPFTGSRMPTVETIYKAVYSPLAKSAIRMLRPGSAAE